MHPLFHRMIVILSVCALILLGLPPKGYAAIKYPGIMPITEVHAGMTGYGLTVFRGTTISKFKVKVIGVVKKGSMVVPGHDMILVRMSGGPMTTRKANLIRGMSGSPVYIDGKIIGAFSQGEPMSTEPLGGVTPIQDMLSEWDPHLPTKPVALLPNNHAQTIVLRKPLYAGSRKITRIVYNVPQDEHIFSHGTTLVMHPCTTFMTCSGLTGDAFNHLKKMMARYNVDVVKQVAGMGMKKNFKGAALVPGASFSMMLATGDLYAGATGTVTYRLGNRILGFGHPFMDIGPIDAPICSAYVYDVYPLLEGSYKIASPGPIVGASDQDRNFAVSGYVGRQPKMIPVTVNVQDETTGRSKVFHVQVITHPDLWAGLVSSVTESAIDEIHSEPGPTVANVVTTVDTDGYGVVTRKNVCYDSHAIDATATDDLDNILDILTNNPFHPVSIKSANISVVMHSAHNTAVLKRIFIKDGQFTPGETFTVGMDIKPYDAPVVTRYLKLTIPENTPNGMYPLLVRGGAIPPALSLGGIIIRAQQTQVTQQAPPASIKEMIQRYEKKEKNNDVLAQLLLRTTSLDVDGEKLPNLPPNMDTLMRSIRSSNVRLDSDQVKTIYPTDWVISGQQLLLIKVQKKSDQENAPEQSPAQEGPPPISPMAPSPGGMILMDQDTSSDNGDSYATEFGMAEKTANVEVKPAKSTPPAQTKGSKNKPSATSSEETESTEETTNTSEKPVGRMVETWTQGTRTDFLKGRFDGTCVTAKGDLTLTRVIKPVASSTESYIWSVIPYGDDSFLLGTGVDGKILRYTPNKGLSVFATLPEVFVRALLPGPDGSVYAATGPNGKTYLALPDGKFRVIDKANEKYALALAKDSQGNLYIGTGGGVGNIYRVQPDGKTELFYHTAEQHVLCLAIDSKNNIYAGTGEDGVIYRISPDGKGSVIFDSKQPSVTSIGIDSKGNIYAVTSPTGFIYKISPDGSSTTLYDKGPGFNALVVAPDNEVYACGSNSLYDIKPDGSVSSSNNSADIDFISLGMDAKGNILIGSGNPGSLFIASAPTSTISGTYTSIVHDAKDTSLWGMIRWDGDTPDGSHVGIQVRTGNIAEPDSTWTGWKSLVSEGDGYRILNPPARYIQYRVDMSANSLLASPTLKNLSISYLPQNHPPKITLLAPTGGERWSGKQTLRWQASDPDKETLTYKVYYSNDQGKTWTLLPSDSISKGKTITTPVSKPSSSANSSEGNPPTMAQVTAELDKHPDLPPQLRAAILNRAKTLLEQNSSKKTSTTSPESENSEAQEATAKETSRILDTKTLPDGIYQFKVVASDYISNPASPLTGDAISDSVYICNTKPVVYLQSSSLKVNADRSVKLNGTAVQKEIAINAVQFRVDKGEWISAIPNDGLFDDPMEDFTIITQPLSPGDHEIEVMAFNTAGLTGTATQKVTVK